MQKVRRPFNYLIGLLFVNSQFVLLKTLPGFLPFPHGTLFTIDQKKLIKA